MSFINTYFSEIYYSLEYHQKKIKIDFWRENSSVFYSFMFINLIFIGSCFFLEDGVF